MAAQINGLFHACTDVGIRSIRKVKQSVFTASAERVIRKIIRGSSGLKSKMPENLKICLFTQNGKIEFSAGHDHIMCQVVFVYGNTDSVRTGGHLSGCINNTAVILHSDTGCQYK